jgi:Squalene-hopene cyclase C-terminal domain
MPSAARTVALARTAVGDLPRWLRRTRPRDEPAPGAVDEGIAWLCRSHDVTGRQGSSKGYSLLEGWRPAFPETTGYVIGTLLARAAQTGDHALNARAREMGDWEIDVQGEDGGIMEGVVTQTPRRSIVFNTGMVLHGWLDLHEFTGDDGYAAAARRAGEFLVHTQLPDGSWSGEATYAHIPHTYNSRVAWALVRLAEATGDERFRETARRKLDWVVSRQRANGWFDDCVFRPGMLPSTHSIAYTLRGLLESGRLLGEERYVAAALRGAEPLVEVFAARRWLPATYDEHWRPRAWYECVTGTAQIGGVWLRLHQMAGEARLREVGLEAVAAAAARQRRAGPPDVRGALPGSFPIFGRYAPLQYPNWAIKFLADSLMLCARVLGEDDPSVPVPGSVPRGA